MRHQLSRGPRGTLCDVTVVTSRLCVPDLHFSHPPAPHIVLLCFLKFQLVFDPKLVLQAHLQDLSWSFQAQRAGCRCTPGLGLDALCVWGTLGTKHLHSTDSAPRLLAPQPRRAPEEKGTPVLTFSWDLGGWAGGPWEARPRPPATQALHQECASPATCPLRSSTPAA